MGPPVVLLSIFITCRSGVEGVVFHERCGRDRKQAAVARDSSFRNGSIPKSGRDGQPGLRFCPLRPGRRAHSRLRSNRRWFRHWRRNSGRAGVAPLVETPAPHAARPALMVSDRRPSRPRSARNEHGAELFALLEQAGEARKVDVSEFRRYGSARTAMGLGRVRTLGRELPAVSIKRTFVIDRCWRKAAFRPRRRPCLTIRSEADDVRRAEDWRAGPLLTCVECAQAGAIFCYLTPYQPSGNG